VYDKAIAAAFKVDLTSEAGETSLVHENELSPLERDLLVRLRARLEFQARIMTKLTEQVGVLGILVVPLCYLPCFTSK
jgi:hypothetical protein